MGVPSAPLFRRSFLPRVLVTANCRGPRGASRTFSATGGGDRRQLLRAVRRVHSLCTRCASTRNWGGSRSPPISSRASGKPRERTTCKCFRLATAGCSCPLAGGLDRLDLNGSQRSRYVAASGFRTIHRPTAHFSLARSLLIYDYDGGARLSGRGSNARIQISSMSCWRRSCCIWRTPSADSRDWCSCDALSWPPSAAS